MQATTKQRLKKLINGCLIFGTFVIVVVLGLKNGDIGQIKVALSRISPIWLLGGLGCYVVYAFMEGAILHLYFRMQGARSRLWGCLISGLIGMYYSSITPAATGGQPMQVFSLKRRGVPPGLTSSALAVKFLGWQSVLMGLGIVAIALRPQLVLGSVGQAKWLLFVGFFANSLTVVGVILLAVMRSFVRSTMIFLVRLFHRLRLVKDVERTSSRWDAALSDFNSSVDVLKREPLQFLAVFIANGIEVMALMSCVYFVYRGLGLSEHSYQTLVTIQLMLYISASITPLPGASGAQEGGFYLFYDKIFPPDTLMAGLLLWRFLTYYLSIIVGFTAVLIDQASGRKRRQALMEGQTTAEACLVVPLVDENNDLSPQEEEHEKQ